MKKLYVEIVRHNKDGFFQSSILKEATKKDILHFKSKPCKHDLKRGSDALIYDIEGFPYDSRYCAVCNTFLGSI